MTTLDIVELIEKNPITKLSSSYNNKLVTKIKENFTESQQQLFVASFYCYLNCDQKNDFIIDLDEVWKWLEFSTKQKLLLLLEKHFVIDKDYKSLLNLEVKQNNGTGKGKGKGGHNKHKYMVTIKTFKSLCLKAGTKKADEIHDYYLKLEDLIHEVSNEETDELKMQLQAKNIIIDNKSEELECKKKELEDQEIKTNRDKELLVEKTLIAQFPLNTQCIYYGKIDNKSGGKPNSKMYHEDMIKFGQSNNLGERVKCHKKNFMNFRLVGAFKVKNKIEIENAIKRHPILKKRIRSLTTIENPNFKEETYRELLALDNDEFSIEKIHDYFEEIITQSEYNIENYNLLLKKADELEDKIKDLENEIREKDKENAKIKSELDKYKPDITTYNQKKIASNYAICKYSYFLYAFECAPMKYKCSISRQKDFETLENNLKNLDKNGEMKYYVKVNYPFSEKIMIFLLKQSFTLLGNNKFEGSYENIKHVLDITTKLENLLIEYGKDLDKLYKIMDQQFNSINENIIATNPEMPTVKKSKRAIDQIDKNTNCVIATYESIEAAGRALGLTTGTAIGIALREKRVCKGFLWRYTGISKEEQYSEQQIVKVCCGTGEKTYFTTIAEAARDSNISAPALRQRVLTHVHVNNHHWNFDKSATHYN
jgi:hypothetical protein